jgi:hypothetical protein
VADVDLGRLRSGELLCGASAAGLLIVLFVDWFSGTSGWDSLDVLRFAIAALGALGLAVVLLTVTARPVAIPVAAANITVGVAVLVLLWVLWRVAVDEPGPNEVVGVELGAYLGVLLTFGVGAGAWRSLQDERTDIPASVRQTERVLAVRGAPRPAPPPRDPSRPDPPGTDTA